jgi:hypothetical protein
VGQPRFALFVLHLAASISALGLGGLEFQMAEEGRGHRPRPFFSEHKPNFLNPARKWVPVDDQEVVPESERLMGGL